MFLCFPCTCFCKKLDVPAKLDADFELTTFLPDLAVCGTGVPDLSYSFPAFAELGAAEGKWRGEIGGGEVGGGEVVDFNRQLLLAVHLL